MKRLFVLLFAVLLHGMAAAEPVRPKTPAGLQALLNDNPLACKVQRVLNERTQKEELVVECDSYPKDLKLSEVALSYFLNSVDDQGNPLATIEESGAIRLKTDMSQYQFEDGFDQRARDVQKETVFGRTRQAEYQKELAGLTKNLDGLTRSFDGMLSKVGWLETWSVLLFGSLVLSGVTGAYALRHIYRIKSGAWDKNAHTKNRQTLEKFLVSKMEEIVKQKQAALDTKVDKESYTSDSQAALKRITDLETKTNSHYTSIKKQTTRIEALENGAREFPAAESPATNSAEGPRKASEIPEWRSSNGLSNGAAHMNGNGAKASGASTLPDLKTQIPVPNTEGESARLTELPMELPEEDQSLSGPVMSLLDKVAEAAAQVTSNQPIEEPDQGEPTKETKLADLHFVDVRSNN